ncbi:MAG: hypothetical protein Fur0021_37260 [Candidatus Promineifilaceae bacterium]
MTTNRDEQLARELDAFLTAQLKGQPTPAISPELQAEARLATLLRQTAAAVEPEPLFLARLEADLVAAAAVETAASSRTDLKTRMPASPPSFWQNLSQNIKETFTMKRFVFTFGAVAALVVIAFFAWTAWRGGQPNEPDVIANVPTTMAETPAPAEPTVAPVEPTVGPAEPTINPELLPTLPSLAGASGLGGGFGGGAEDSSKMIATDPLSGTQYVLNTTLPIEPITAVVYDTANQATFTLDDVARLASLFGLSGTIYTETYYQEPGNEWTPSPVYQIFDGPRQLAVGDIYFSYMDNSGLVNGSADPMPFAQAGPIAEAYLRERGLLEFPYQMVSQNGYDIEIRRLVDGHVAIFPEIQVSVNSSGLVWAVFSNPMSSLSPLGNYPLRSAAEAWQFMQEHGVDFQSVFYNTYPGPDFVQPPMPVDAQDYRYWQRQYVDGQTVTMYPYPMVFLPVNGDAAPRIVIDQYLLTGPAEELQAIAAYVGRQIQVTGVVTGDVQQMGVYKVIELVSWQPLESLVEYTFREGVVSRSGEQVTLVVSETESYIIPDAPADLNDGERIYVSGWIDAPNVFNWQGMGIVTTEPASSEMMPVDSFLFQSIGQVTINQVELVYAVVSVYDEATQTSRFLFSPAWRFQGTTDRQEMIDIYVQAVPDTLVASPAQY